jgi:ribosomal protein S18 acetylase RimI-like enzyme
MEYKIRKFRFSDLAEVIEIEKEFPPNNRNVLDERSAVELLRKYPNACWVAEKDGRIIGFLLARVDEEHCSIMFLNIRPEYIGEGIPSDLIHKMLKNTGNKVLVKL